MKQSACGIPPLLLPIQADFAAEVGADQAAVIGAMAVVGVRILGPTADIVTAYTMATTTVAAGKCRKR